MFKKSIFTNLLNANGIANEFNIKREKDKREKIKRETRFPSSLKFFQRKFKS